MNNRRTIVALAVLLTALLTVAMVPSCTDSDGANRGSASADGIIVSYIDSVQEGYGIMSVSFVSPDSDSFNVTVDGKRSASIPVADERLLVPGGLSIGDHEITVECGKDTWSLVLHVSDVCDHEWGSGMMTKRATCTTAGIRTYTCSICGETMSETVPATGHSWSEWTIVKEATSTEKGLEERTCSECGEKQTQAIPETGHNWSDWTVVKEATQDSEGLKERTCIDCGEKESAVIPKVKVIDNSDGTKTRTSEDADGTEVSETTGFKDGSKKVEAVSSDGKVKSSAVISRSGEAEIVTVMDIGPGTVVSKEQIEQAISVQERASKDASNQKSKVILVGLGSSDTKLTMTGEAFEAAAGSGSELRVASDTGAIRVGEKVLRNIAGHEEASITVAKAMGLNDAQNESVAGGTAIDVSIMSGGKSLGDSLGGSITITIKHNPAEGKVAVAYYVDDHGSKQKMQDTVYDSESGEVSFTTAHCSIYVVFDEEPGSANNDGDDNSMLYIGVAVAIVIIVAAVLIARAKL